VLDPQHAQDDLSVFLIAILSAAVLRLVRSSKHDRQAEAQLDLPYHQSICKLTMVLARGRGLGRETVDAGG
jgi:hypothetical protein